MVADEVRKLAERTRVSTTEITQTVTKIRSCMQEAESGMAAGNQRVLEAVAESERTEASMTGIQSAAAMVVEKVDDITSLLREQNSSSKEIARNVISIAAGSEQVSRSAESMTSIASHLECLAGDLDHAARRFRLVPA